MKRKFGTEEYRASGLVKFLDRWVANITHFEENFENYRTLTEMPGVMQKMIEREQKRVDGLFEEAKKIEERVEKKYELSTAIKTAEELEKEKENTTAQMRSHIEQYRTILEERKSLDTAQDPFQVEAVQRLKAVYEGEDISSLRERARKTKTREDDQIVDQIELADGRISSLKEQAEEAKKTQNISARRLSGLEKIKTYFSNRNYDSSRSDFDSDFEIGNWLNRYLTGKCSSDEIIRKLDENHHKKPDPSTYHSSRSSYGYKSDGWRSSSGSSFGSGFGSSSSSSSSGFGTSGGFSSGGSFRTTGGF